MLYSQLVLLGAALSNHGVFAGALRPRDYRRTGFNDGSYPPKMGSMTATPSLDGTRSGGDAQPKVVPLANLTGTVPVAGNGTAASCDGACRDEFKTRVLMANAADAAMLVLDR